MLGMNSMVASSLNTGWALEGYQRVIIRNQRMQKHSKGKELARSEGLSPEQQEVPLGPHS